MGDGKHGIRKQFVYNNYYECYFSRPTALLRRIQRPRPVYTHTHVHASYCIFACSVEWKHGQSGAPQARDEPPPPQMLRYHRIRWVGPLITKQPTPHQPARGQKFLLNARLRVNRSRLGELDTILDNTYLTGPHWQKRLYLALAWLRLSLLHLKNRYTKKFHLLIWWKLFDANEAASHSLFLAAPSYRYTTIQIST